jgi:outer membrane cobalamin receptor
MRTSTLWRTSLELVARVANLLDRRYEEALGFPAPGRVGTIGVRIAVGK